MAVIYLILLLAALVCFLIAAFAQHRIAQVNLIALGLAFWVLVVLIPAFQTV